MSNVVRYGASILGILFIVFLLGVKYGRSKDVSQSTVVKTDQQTKTDTKRTTVIVKTPDGGTKTTIVEDISVKTKSKQDAISIREETSKYSLTNVSAIASLDFSSKPTPVYGVSISKEIIGPVTFGVVGLTNGMFGVSIGINF